MLFHPGFPTESDHVVSVFDGLNVYADDTRSLIFNSRGSNHGSQGYESTLADDLKSNSAETIVPLSRTMQSAKGSVPSRWYAIQ
jgi:hypothetical protein